MATITLNRVIGAALTLGIGSLLGSEMFYVVPAGHRGLVFDRLQGIKVQEPKNEGLHFLIPFWQWPIFVSTRIMPKTMRTQTQTKDIQTINIGLRVLYRPDVDNLPLLIKNYGADYAERFLPSIGNEVMKAVVAKYDAVELITQRDKVSHEIRERLNERAGHYYLRLNDVSITDLSFSPEFTSAIERKQIAQQEAEKAKYVVQRTEQERLAVVIRAEGEAEAAQLISEATARSGEAFVELRRIDAAREVAQALSKNEKVTYLPAQNNSNNNSGGGSPQLLLNMGK